MGNRLKGKDLIQMGFPKNNALNLVLAHINKHRKNDKKANLMQEAKEVLQWPDKYLQDETWGLLADSLLRPEADCKQILKTTRAPFAFFGEAIIDEQAKYQMYEALKLPIALSGALMPDAHSGYGLPIGGVLTTENAVIPYGVGVDIGCRMSLSIFDLPAHFLKGKNDLLMKILGEHTKFGMSEIHKNPADHEVFSHEGFNEISLLKSLKQKAYQQLGTSGSGNHFVEFGIVHLYEVEPSWKLEPGTYGAVLSHSGSRSLGANIAEHYTRLATQQCNLPKHVQHLAWLELDSQAGQEYWLAMNLAGEYAKACHDEIHRRIAKALGQKRVVTIENHHNFAWKETLEGRECIVHRKGATPAQKGVLGIIPGSMTEPGYLVRGRGNPSSLDSASHGAGRLHSRGACKRLFTHSEMKKELKKHDVMLMGGGIDEAPMAYKSIQEEMNYQSELIDVLGSFTPKVVRMA